jgi:hypothetical protein
MKSWWELTSYALHIRVDKLLLNRTNELIDKHSVRFNDRHASTYSLLSMWFPIENFRQHYRKYPEQALYTMHLANKRIRKAACKRRQSNEYLSLCIHVHIHRCFCLCPWRWWWFESINAHGNTSFIVVEGERSKKKPN